MQKRTDPSNRRLLISHRDFKVWQAVMATVTIMAAMICFVYFCRIPNPNMILIAGLVICSAVFGFPGGIPASIIMFGYTLFFFSEDNSFIRFADQDKAKVLVSLFGIIVDMIFVCTLKKRENDSYRILKNVSDDLITQNAQLLEQANTDTLTKINNRRALNRNTESYLSKRVQVMMLDIDGFKSINDVHGHAYGDIVLSKTGELLLKTFNKGVCYRYGGDEFLVIVPGEMSDAEFAKKVDQLSKDAPSFERNGQVTNISYSVGRTEGIAETASEFRKLVEAADNEMYKIKKEKNILR